MSTGTGIAILGVWLLPAAAAISPNVPSRGWFSTAVIAAVATFLLTHYVG